MTRRLPVVLVLLAAWLPPRAAVPFLGAEMVVTAGAAEPAASPRELRPIRTLPTPKSWVAAVAFSPDGRHLASGGDDQMVRVWDWSRGRQQAAWQIVKEGVTALAYGPARKLPSDKELPADRKPADGEEPQGNPPLAVGFWDGTLGIIDAQTGKVRRQLSGHTETITSLAFRPDGGRIASGSGDDSLRVWDTGTGEELLTLAQDNEYDITTVAFSPDGKRLATGDGENTVKIWDARTGRELAALSGHEATVTAVAFLPDGRRLVSASWDRTVRLWDVVSEEALAVWRGHEAEVTSLAVNSAGTRVVSGSEDRTLRVWEVQRGACLSVLRGAAGSVTSVAIHPNGRTLAVGSRDGVAIWRLR